LGIVLATRLALQRAGLGIDDVDVIEFNEAFAGQVLAFCTEPRLDPERVCPEGGALALGHPWGASGAVLAVRAFSQLARRPGGYGLVAVAVGGDQGWRWFFRAVVRCFCLGLCRLDADFRQ
jgi:acetyl-CoA C-acetyltransferase